MQPNHGLAVHFYERAEDMGYESEKEGRPISRMVDFVRIEIPGDRNTVIDTIVEQTHRDRFPLEWARYVNNKAAGTPNIPQGTLLSDWPILNAAQVRELQHFKFYTVEQVAEAPDAHLQAVGMAAGMAWNTFRDKARAYLSRAKDAAFSQQQASELAKRDAEIDSLKAQLAEINKAILEQQSGKRSRRETAEA